MYKKVLGYEFCSFRVRHGLLSNLQHNPKGGEPVPIFNSPMPQLSHPCPRQSPTERPVSLIRLSKFGAPFRSQATNRTVHLPIPSPPMLLRSLPRALPADVWSLRLTKVPTIQIKAWGPLMLSRAAGCRVRSTPRCKDGEARRLQGQSRTPLKTETPMHCD